MDLVFQMHRPEVVFHAAAHKHVPLMELHPAEAVKTNISAPATWPRQPAGMVPKISADLTDKAVNPPASWAPQTVL